MRLKPFVRTAAVLGVACSLASISAPSSLAQTVAPITAAAPSVAPAPKPAATPAPPPRRITVTITDQGFDQQVYTVGGSNGTTQDEAQIVFMNKGTTIHTATFVPGTFGWGVSIGQRVDGNGNQSSCWQFSKCTGATFLDTGGIEPGGSVTMGMGQNVPATFPAITSATDCLNGNASSTFNCTPVAIKLVPISNSGATAGTYQGSVFAPAGDPNCAVTVNNPGGGVPSFCFTPVRQYVTTAGSAKAPLDSTTVTIDDIKGFQPTVVYVKAGSSVTWVNNGLRTHSVDYLSSGYCNICPLLSSGGLAPGESFTYTFADIGCHPEQADWAPNGCGYKPNYQSTIDLDMMPNSGDGGIGVGSKGACKFKGSCGQSGMIGRIAVIDAPQAS